MTRLKQHKTKSSWKVFVWQLKMLFHYSEITKYSFGISWNTTNSISQSIYLLWLHFWEFDNLGGISSKQKSYLSSNRMYIIVFIAQDLWSIRIKLMFGSCWSLLIFTNPIFIHMAPCCGFYIYVDKSSGLK